MFTISTYFAAVVKQSRVVLRDGYAVDGEEGVADGDAVSLAEHDEHTIRVRLQLDVERVAERLLHLLRRQVVVVVVDEPTGLGHDEDIEHTHDAVGVQSVVVELRLRGRGGGDVTHVICPHL